ncbi:MAG: hypothetical protein K9H25_07350 [Rhodospirillum sp.]|nr:hypothetical protein [Rhodospirillum sp.]MCF8488764.1 hypothetical protein [Rhodospirillum sp.]MCF8499716.1 hypothetical protein [Rhodospirillum sp.]
MRFPVWIFCLFLLASCAGTPRAVAPLPSEPWLTGPPDPMQVIDVDKTRLLIAVPSDLDRGRRYKALVARYLFVHLLDGGVVLYGRYAKDWSMAEDTDAGALTLSLYRDALAREAGVQPDALTSGRHQLPFGETYVLKAQGPARSCVAFFAPLRVGRAAPEGTWDSYLRGALCGRGDPWPVMESILRSVVLRE